MRSGREAEGENKMRVMPLPLPNFKLAELKGIKPFELVRDNQDRVGALMLALSLAYNDLKDAEYCATCMQDLKPWAESDTLARWGQYAGMKHHVARAMSGIAHQILSLLFASRRGVNEPEFQHYLARLNAEYRADWEVVWSAARQADDKPKRSDALSRVLREARNSLAFHYDVNRLTRGYREFFTSGEAHSTHAVVAIGDSLETTRFYFADPAATAGVAIATAMDTERFIEELNEACDRLHKVLWALIRQWIDARASAQEEYPPSSSDRRPPVRASLGSPAVGRDGGSTKRGRR